MSVINKYLVLPFFTDEAFDSDNTAATSAQFDIGEVRRAWLQYTGGSTAGDVHAQVQMSNDAMSLPASRSSWLNEGSAIGITASDTPFQKLTVLGAQKMRVVLTRQSGTATLSVRGIGKSI